MRNFILVAVAVAALAGCVKKAESGDPVKMFLPPLTDAKAVDGSVRIFKDFLEKATGREFEISSPASFPAVVEAFGEKKVDVSAIDTFGYLKARETSRVEARLTVVRNGLATYRSQFIAKADRGIKSIADLNGKTIAFVDPNSASGYLLPLKTLKDQKIDPRDVIFATKPETVVTMVYQGTVDAGATDYGKPSAQGIEDARRLVMKQYPDVERKVKIIGLTDAIPNDPIVFARAMPEEMKAKIVDAILAFLKTPGGKKAFQDLYAIDELKKCTDEDYDSVRELLTTLGKSAGDLMGK